MPRLVIGLQPVREAVRVHGSKLTRVLVDRASKLRGGREGATGTRLAALARFAGDQRVAVEYVSRQELDRLSPSARHQGVVAEAPELQLHRLDELDLRPEATRLIALDGITDPQNFGAIIRSAVAFAADAIIWPEHHSAPLSPATFRASAGAVEHATLCRVQSLRQALEQLKQQAVTAVALEAAASTPLSALPLTKPVVLVVGSEDRGISRAVRRTCQFRASLPMLGPLGSLNASAAAAVALYELTRRSSSGMPGS